jgi:hypothetical protein
VGSSQRSATSATDPRPARSAPTRVKHVGCEAPRIWTPPLRELTPETSLGFECIQFAEDILGLELMPWQRWFLIHALELHPTDTGSDGKPLFRFRKVIFLVGRQNGKSTVMQALTLWRMFVDRCSLVIGTAQDLEIAETLLRESYELAEEVDELKSEMGSLVRGSGKMSFRLSSGETYKVKAASRRGGRGLSGQLVLLDELREHQSWDAWAAVTKTTNAQERAQIYGISNAGDASSIVLRYLRKMAHAELGDPDKLNSDVGPEDLLEDDEEVDDSALGIFEWSAPPGALLGDRDAWAQANPSLGYRVRESTLASDAKTDPEWVFRTEVLCQWSDGTLEGPFPPGAWDAGKWSPGKTKVPPQIVGKVKCGIAMSQDRGMTFVSFAGRDARGRAQVEIVARRAGDEWVEEWLRDPKRALLVEEIAGQGRGAPESGLVEALRLSGLPVVKWEASGLPEGCGRFYDAVRDNDVTHLAWPELDVAAATAVPRLTEAGSFVWDRKRSPVDVAALMAANAAHWLLTRPSEKPTESVYESRGMVTL